MGRDRGRDYDRVRRHKGREKADDYQHRKRSSDREDRHRKSTNSPRRHKGKEKADDYQHRKRSSDREDRHRKSTNSPRRKKRKSGFDQMPEPPPERNFQICVCGLPSTATEKSLESLLKNAMAKIGGKKKSSDKPDTVEIRAEIDPGRKFALVKMRSEEEASNALALDGINFEGVPLRILRPRCYNPLSTSKLVASESTSDSNLNLGVVNPLGLRDAKAGYEDQIIVSGIPCHLDEEAVRRLLVNHGGQIEDLSIEHDTTTGDLNVKCLYFEPSVADDACRSLNGFKFGDKTITARRVHQS